MREITTATADERLTALWRATDPNQKYPLNLSQLQQLAKSLQQFATANEDFQQIADGINNGIISWQRIQANLLNWMY